MDTPSSPRHKQAVWLDCDPGHDDAFAIILAGHSDALELLGISTVAGNQSVEKTTTNALTVAAISGLGHIEVVKGQSTPLIKPSLVCPEIHGTSGLDCAKGMPEVQLRSVVPKKAVLHMYEVIANFPRKVTLVATACLTNVALLLALFPEVKSNIDQIVLLGGAMGIGNMTPVAEFNILVDPDAARMVFESGVRIVMVPLEVSHSAVVTPAVLARVQALGTPYADLMVDLLMFFARTYLEVFKFNHPPLHDPLAVAYVIDPSLFSTTLMRVDIETQSALCAGQTVCDVYHMSERKKNVHVATSVRIEAFWDAMLDAVRRANDASILNLPRQSHAPVPSST